MSLSEEYSIFKNINYLTSQKYIAGRIVEYDIKSSNITMLRKYGIIDERYYNFLSNLPKKDREKEVGNLKRLNKKYYDTERNGIYEAMLKFVELNNIDILSIVRKANDALYINTPIDLKYTDIDGVIFRPKSVYTSALVLDNIIFLFYYNNEGICVDVKGISTEALSLHNGYMLTVIGTAVFLLEKGTIEESMTYVSNIIDDYLNFRLDINYYRSFDNISKFVYLYQGFCSDIPANYNEMDINRNLFLLRELYSIIFSIYSTRK